MPSTTERLQFIVAHLDAKEHAPPVANAAMLCGAALVDRVQSREAAVVDADLLRAILAHLEAAAALEAQGVTLRDVKKAIANWRVESNAFGMLQMNKLFDRLSLLYAAPPSPASEPAATQEPESDDLSACRTECSRLRDRWQKLRERILDISATMSGGPQQTYLSVLSMMDDLAVEQAGKDDAQ